MPRFDSFSVAASSEEAIVSVAKSEEALVFDDSPNRARN